MWLFVSVCLWGSSVCVCVCMRTCMHAMCVCVCVRCARVCVQRCVHTHSIWTSRLSPCAVRAHSFCKFQPWVCADTHTHTHASTYFISCDVIDGELHGNREWGRRRRPDLLCSGGDEVGKNSRQRFWPPVSQVVGGASVLPWDNTPQMGNLGALLAVTPTVLQGGGSSCGGSAATWTPEHFIDLIMWLVSPSLRQVFPFLSQPSIRFSTSAALGFRWGHFGIKRYISSLLTFLQEQPRAGSCEPICRQEKEKPTLLLFLLLF